MSENLQAAIKELQAQVDQKADELANLKRTVNLLCTNLGERPIYPESEESATPSGWALSAHEFYGKTPIVAARTYLEMIGEPVPVEEILDAFVRGGFDFEEQGWDEKARLRALAISLSKNTAIFHKLPNGTYGLMKWYPTKAKKKKRRAASLDPRDFVDDAQADMADREDGDEDETTE